MKKTVSLLLALLIAAFCFVPVFAQNNQPGMGKYAISEGVYVLPESVKEINEDDFKDINAKVVLITSETIDISRFSGLEDAVIILPDTAMSSEKSDAKFDADKAAKNWFAYDVFKIFGKTILTFLYYDKQIDEKTCVWDEDTCIWYDELIKITKPDYVNFRFEEPDKESSFYVSGSVSGAEIAKYEGAGNDPGFLQKLILNFCLSEIEPKTTYGGHPGGKGGNFLVSLFRILFK